jgi:L-lactate dehydrogenase complex protein LldG
VVDRDFRRHAAAASAGLTGANFAIAATGTVVLESTDEALRLATTLPPVHFVLLDPRKIVADSTAAVPLLRRFHERLPQAFLAYITGPSRTADIERVLTIGVHGPKELHVLLCEGMSDDFMES